MNRLIHAIIAIAILGVVVWLCHAIVPMPVIFVQAIDILAVIGLVVIVLYFVIGLLRSYESSEPPGRWPL